MCGGEFPSELISEVRPAEELGSFFIFRLLFPAENGGRPFLSAAGLHIGHGPYDLCLFIQEFSRT
jgi:hypothetical protein